MSPQENSTSTPFAGLRSAVSPIRKALANIICPRPPFSELSFSQEGEDMILRSLFEGRESGFYVDVGAHHPQRLSNTNHFYLSGWRGINIDAMPGSMEPFKRFRQRDTNLEIGVSESTETLTYYAFDEPAFNGFSQEIADRVTKSGKYKLLFDQTGPDTPAGRHIGRISSANQTIDFLTIDVEGLDQAVLRSNNWKKYLPVVILTETLHVPAASGAHFLRSLGYRELCSTPRTQFFCRDDFHRGDPGSVKESCAFFG